MNEPIRTPEFTPDSYQPKDKPEILKLMEQARQDESQLPSEFIIKPKESVAEFSGEKWPFSNVEPAVYSALGLLYGRTERRDDSGALINDDIEYAIHNVLTGHAFGLFFDCLGNDFSELVYGFSSSPLETDEYSADELQIIIKDQLYRGNAIHINATSEPFDYLVWGYKDDGNTLVGHKFEHGNDMVNCSYDFDNPVEFDSLTTRLNKNDLFKFTMPIAEKPGSIKIIQPSGEKIENNTIYKRALTEGCRMLTQTEPNPEMDFNRVHFGYGQAIYDEWTRQIEQAEAENKEEFFNTSPIFPHFIALYENRLHILRFLKHWNEQIDNEYLHNAIELCEVLKSISSDAATCTMNRHWNPMQNSPNHDKRMFLLDALKKCRALELEIAEQLKAFLDAPDGYQPKDKPEIISLINDLKQSKIDNMIKYHIVELENVRYIDLPATRFIGKNVKGGPDEYGAMWGKVEDFMPILSDMMEYSTEITTNCALMHYSNRKYDEPGGEMHYIIGKFMKADTPVPEGFDYWDMAPTTIGFAVVQGEFSDMISKAMMIAHDKIVADGYTITYPDNYFNAEVYLNECIPEDGVVSKLGYLHACMKKEKPKINEPIPALDVGVWPLPEGQYDPTLSGTNIPAGARLYGLFDERYNTYPAPDSVPGFGKVTELESLEKGEYYVLNASSGFSYIVVMSDKPVTIMTGGYNSDTLDGYQPKDKPVIISMAENSYTTKESSPEIPAVEIVRTFKKFSPAMRFIGKSYSDEDRVNGFFGAKWGEWYQNGWFNMLTQLGSIEGMNNDIGGVHGRSDGFKYWIGRFTPAGTPVPEGFDFIDYDAASIGTCRLKGFESDIYGKEVMCLNHLRDEGYEMLGKEFNSKFVCFERYFGVDDTDEDFSVLGNGKMFLDICFFVK